MVKITTETCFVGWNKSERAKVRELCFVWVGTADAWLTKQDDDDHIYRQE
jgi:hypothetical protein